jgi:signal peptidase II
MSFLRDKYGVLAIGAVASLVADQLVKAAIIARLPVDAGIAVIPGFFEICHARNSGAAFSLFVGNPLAFFLAANVAAISLLVYFFVRLERGQLLIAGALSMILGGALGNLLDRLRHGGAVVDFLRFYVRDYAWPTFNVADMAIVAGVALFALDMLRADRPARRPQGG